MIFILKSYLLLSWLKVWHDRRGLLAFSQTANWYELEWMNTFFNPTVCDALLLLLSLNVQHWQTKGRKMSAVLSLIAATWAEKPFLLIQILLLLHFSQPHTVVVVDFLCFHDNLLPFQPLRVSTSRSRRRGGSAVTWWEWRWTRTWPKNSCWRPSSPVVGTHSGITSSCCWCSRQHWGFLWAYLEQENIW